MKIFALYIIIQLMMYYDIFGASVSTKVRRVIGRDGLKLTLANQPVVSPLYHMKEMLRLDVLKQRNPPPVTTFLCNYW